MSVTLLTPLARQAALSASRRSDNGVGIAEPDRLHIFERFYRSSGQSTTGKAGLGVGLYIAHEVVVQMGGTLTFQTGPRGTCFILVLPVP